MRVASKLLYLFSYICLAVDDDGVSDQAAMHAARHLKEYIRRELGHLAETTRHKIVCAATPPGFTASRLADREQGRASDARRQLVEPRPPRSLAAVGYRCPASEAVFLRMLLLFGHDPTA